VSEKLAPVAPLTPEQVKEFDGYMAAWRERLGLHDWRIVRSRKKSKNMAEVVIHHADRLVSYKVGTDFGATPVTPLALEATALHEMLHVMLCELVNQTEYGITDQALQSAEHRVINALVNLVLKTHE